MMRILCFLGFHPRNHFVAAPEEWLEDMARHGYPSGGGRDTCNHCGAVRAMGGWI